MKEFLKKMVQQKLNMILLGGGAIVILVLGVIFLPKLLHPDAGKVTTISQSSLEKLVNIEDLETLEYTYNAVAQVKDEERDVVKYHVAYEGKVKAGIDFSKIKVDVKEKEKKISVVVPEAEVQNISVEMGSLDFIFTRDRYETETVSQEGYQKSLEDLEMRAKDDPSILKMAKESAVSVVSGLIEPWVKQVDSEYTVEIK